MLQGEALFIAMAGQHQIWRHDLRAGTTRAFSGDGYERNANGRSGPATSWAQVCLWTSPCSAGSLRGLAVSCGAKQMI